MAANLDILRRIAGQHYAGIVPTVSDMHTAEVTHTISQIASTTDHPPASSRHATIPPKQIAAAFSLSDTCCGVRPPSSGRGVFEEVMD